MRCLSVCSLLAFVSVLVPEVTIGLESNNVYIQAVTGSCGDNPFIPKVACVDRKRCVLTARLCDGKDDCADGSDETESACRQILAQVCPEYQSNSSQFQCKYGTTVARSLVCDGKTDCTDGSDELECKRCFCKASDSFKCEYGACIDKDKRCDGRKDCPDGSDEQDCSNKGGTPHTTSTTTTTMATTEEPSNKPCRVPPHPPHGKHSKLCSVGRCKVGPGDLVPHDTRLVTGCYHRHQLEGGDGYAVCDNGLWQPFSHTCIECGVSKNEGELVPLIINGEDSELGDFPWIAALYRQDRETRKWQHYCGATLITPHILVTAAHCVTANGEKFLPEDILVGLGALHWDYYHEEDSKIIAKVREVVVPERYVGKDNFYTMDIALLDLTKSVPLSPDIKPACVDVNNRFHLKAGVKGYVAGWGVTEEGRHSELQQKAQQQYVEYETCVKTIRQKNTVTSTLYITHDKFCMASANDARADKGDSGGGLTFIMDGAHYLMGVVSTLLREGVPMVFFTNITNREHHSWMRSEQRRLAKLHY